MRVLHLEDELDVIEIVKLMLKGSHDYTGTSLISEALSIINAGKVDVLLLDLKLSKESRINGLFEGESFINELIRLKKKVNIILLSALSEECKKIKRKYPEMVKAIINKPFTKEQLIKAINLLSK